MASERERLSTIKIVVFYIIVSVTFLFGQAVPTKWRPCQDTIMVAETKTIEAAEKTIENKLKVLQLTNEGTDKIAGSKLLKPIQRHRKLLESRIEECHEIKANIQELKVGRGDGEEDIKEWSAGIEAKVQQYEHVVEELEDLERSLREREARETQEKEEKVKWKIKKKFDAKPDEKESEGGKSKVSPNL